MKNGRTIAVTAVIALLVVALAVVGLRLLMSPEKRAALKRISDYEVVAAEQRLITEILTLKMDAAIIQSKFAEARQRAEAAAPVQRSPMPNESPPRERIEIPELGVEGEFIPYDELPEDMR